MRIYLDSTATVCGVTSDFLSPRLVPNSSTGIHEPRAWISKLFLRSESFGAILIHEDTGREALVDTEGRELIRHVFAKQEIAPREKGFLDVLGKYLLDEAVNDEEFYSWTSPLTGRTILHAPLFLRWEITSNCNLHCVHCYNEYGTEPDLNTKEALDLLEVFARECLFQIRFGGGEPFIRKDFLVLLKRAHELGLRPNFVTNGTLITALIADELAKIGVGDVFVSIDGATPATHDHFRGKSGSWKKACEGVRELRAAGITVGLQSMLHPGNMSEVDALITLALELGVQALVFKIALPCGRASDGTQALSQWQLMQAAAQLAAQRIRQRERVLIGNLELMCASSSRSPIQSSKPVSCGPGYRTATLRPDGTMVACHYLQKPEWRSERVTPKNFVSVWQKSPVFETFRGLRASDLSACRNCSKFLQSCVGGCRARALLSSGSFWGPDSLCIGAAFPAESIRGLLSSLLRQFESTGEWMWRDVGGTVILLSNSSNRFLKMTPRASLVWRVIHGYADVSDLVENGDYATALKEVEQSIRVFAQIRAFRFVNDSKGDR